MLNIFLFYNTYKYINGPLNKLIFVRRGAVLNGELKASKYRRHSSHRMVNVLNVAEKNDAAKHLAKIMSGENARCREGRSRFNKLYEFDYHLFNTQCKMIMTSVSGHLLDIEFAGSYRKWSSCNPVALFDGPIKKFCPEKFLDIKRTLEEQAKRCSKLIIWTDGDREGENIGFEIIEVCLNVKPQLDVYRARFSEITAQAVARACRNLARPDQNQNNAVEIRRELDLRIGAAFTRFQTLRLQRVFPEVLSDQLISYGSCQFPTLGFVVERYKQARNFLPEPFWKLKVLHKKDDIPAEFSWKRHRLFEHTACLVLLQRCTENPEAVVTDVKNKSKSKWRPQPLDTVEMEKLGSRKLRINAKVTMSIAEKLYTQGLISYPRTETTIFPKEIDLSELVRQHVQDPRWGDFAGRVLEQGPNPRQGTKTDNAHPPIHPIKHTTGLEGQERQLYEFIVRHFLACVSDDAKGYETTVDIKVSDEEFSTSGLVIIARNYLDVYPYDKWSDKEIPQYERGEHFMPESIEMVEGNTSAPPLLTEADLIALMDKHGIGTDATHAEHIERIKDRLYVGLNNDNRFVPGELGMGLVEGYENVGHEMSKPTLRAEFESDLKSVCEGNKDSQVVLQEQITKYKEVFVEAVSQANKIDEALSVYFGNAHEVAPNVINEFEVSPVMKCPKCHTSDVVLRKKRDGISFYLSCMSYPECKSAIWLPAAVESVSIHESVCQDCQPGPVKNLKFKFKRGSYAPLLPDEVIKCVGGCDPNFMEALDIHAITRNMRPAPEAPQRMNANRVPDHDGRLRRGDGGVNINNALDRNGNHNPRRNTGAGRDNTNNSLNRSGNSNPRTRDLNSQNGPSDDVKCMCGQPATLLTTRKEGPNIGRQFYKCPCRDGQNCNFFQWADAPVAALPQRQHGPAQADPNATECKCGYPAKLLTVLKEGPNNGRQFYSCSKPRDQSCNFFLWADGEENRIQNNRGNYAAPSGTGDRSNKKARVSSNAAEGGRKRKCGNCGQEGHDRRNCTAR